MSDTEIQLSAISTEHFAMQGAISTAVSEQQARASMFLNTVSGALIAIGLMVKSEHQGIIIIAILGVLLVVGIVTIFRLVDIAMESLLAHVTVARLRKHYRSLGTQAAKLFDAAHGRWPEGRTDSGSVHGTILGLMTSAASMVACVVGVIGAALLALLLHRTLAASLVTSLWLSGLAAAAFVAIILCYQAKRIGVIVQLARSANLVIGDDRQSRFIHRRLLRTRS